MDSLEWQTSFTIAETEKIKGFWSIVQNFIYSQERSFVNFLCLRVRCKLRQKQQPTRFQKRSPLM